MAKVQYHLGNFQGAELNLTTVLQCNQFKDSYEALRMLAQIKARQSQNNHAEAHRLFNKVIERNPKDFDAHFEIAVMFEVNDPKLALQHYKRGIQIIREQISADDKSKFVEQWQSSYINAQAHLDLAQSMVPVELLNNLAVLMIESGETNQA